jgi:hypothetical protein
MKPFMTRQTFASLPTSLIMTSHREEDAEDEFFRVFID